MNKSSRKSENRYLSFSSGRLVLGLIAILTVLAVFTGCNPDVVVNGSAQITLKAPEGVTPAFYVCSINDGPVSKPTLDENSTFVLSDLKAGHYKIMIQACNLKGTVIGTSVSEFDVEDGKVTAVEIKWKLEFNDRVKVNFKFKSVDHYPEADNFLYTVTNLENPDQPFTYKLLRGDIQDFFVKLEQGEWTVTIVPRKGEVALGVSCEPVKFVVSGINDMNVTVDAIKYVPVTLSVVDIPDSADRVNYKFFIGDKYVDGITTDADKNAVCTLNVLPGKYTVKAYVYGGNGGQVVAENSADFEVVEYTPAELAMHPVAKATYLRIRRPSNFIEQLTSYHVIIKNSNGEVIDTLVGKNTDEELIREVEPHQEYSIQYEAYIGEDCKGHSIEKKVKPDTSAINDVILDIRYENTWAKLKISAIVPPDFTEMAKILKYDVYDSELQKSVASGCLNESGEAVVEIKDPKSSYMVYVRSYRNETIESPSADLGKTWIVKIFDTVSESYEIKPMVGMIDISVDTRVSSLLDVENYYIVIKDVATGEETIIENRGVFLRVPMGKYKVSGKGFNFVVPDTVQSAGFDLGEITVYPGEIYRQDVEFEPVLTDISVNFGDFPEDTSYFEVDNSRSPAVRVERGNAYSYQYPMGRFKLNIKAFDNAGDPRGEQTVEFSVRNTEPQTLSCNITPYEDQGILNINILKLTDAASYKIFCTDDTGKTIEKDNMEFSLESGNWNVIVKAFNENGDEIGASTYTHTVAMKTGVTKKLDVTVALHSSKINFIADVPDVLMNFTKVEKFNPENGKWDMVGYVKQEYEDIVKPGTWKYKVVVRDDDNLLMGETEEIEIVVDRGLSYRKEVKPRLFNSYLNVALTDVKDADCFKIVSSYRDYNGAEGVFTSDLVSVDSQKSIELPNGNHRIGVYAYRNNIEIANTSVPSAIDILPGKAGRITPTMEMIPYSAKLTMTPQTLPVKAARYVFTLTDGKVNKTYDLNSDYVYASLEEGKWTGSVRAYDKDGWMIGWTDTGMSIDARWGETGNHNFKIAEKAADVNITFNALEGAARYVVTIDENVTVPFENPGTYKIYVIPGEHNLKVTAYDSVGPDAKLLSETRPYRINGQPAESIKLEWNGSASFDGNFIMPELPTTLPYESNKAGCIRWTLTREGETDIVIEQLVQNERVVSQNVKPGLWNVTAEALRNNMPFYRQTFTINVPEKTRLAVDKTSFAEKDIIKGIDGVLDLDFSKCLDGVDVKVKLTNLKDPSDVIEKTFVKSSSQKMNIPCGLWKFEIMQNRISGTANVRVYPGLEYRMAFAPSGAEILVTLDKGILPTPVVSINGGLPSYVAGDRIELSCNHDSFKGVVEVEWFLDGGTVVIGNGDALSFDSIGMTEGNHSISVKVTERESGRLVMFSHVFTVTK